MMKVLEDIITELMNVFFTQEIITFLEYSFFHRCLQQVQVIAVAELDVLPACSACRHPLS